MTDLMLKYIFIYRFSSYKCHVKLVAHLKSYLQSTHDHRKNPKKSLKKKTLNRSFFLNIIVLIGWWKIYEFQSKPKHPSGQKKKQRLPRTEQISKMKYQKKKKKRYVFSLFL